MSEAQSLSGTRHKAQAMIYEEGFCAARAAELNFFGEISYRGNLSLGISSRWVLIQSSHPSNVLVMTLATLSKYSGAWFGSATEQEREDTHLKA